MGPPEIFVMQSVAEPQCWGYPPGLRFILPFFAIDSKSAGELSAVYLQGKATTLREMEVMDIDEKAFRKGRVSARLYDYMRVPFQKMVIQNPKAGSTTREDIRKGQPTDKSKSD